MIGGDTFHLKSLISKYLKLLHGINLLTLFCEWHVLIYIHQPVCDTNSYLKKKKKRRREKRRWEERRFASEERLYGWTRVTENLVAQPICMLFPDSSCKTSCKNRISFTSCYKLLVTSNRLCSSDSFSLGSERERF